MEDIFKNAYFGKKYNTRGGDIAIYIRGYEGSCKCAMLQSHMLITQDRYLFVNDDGTEEGHTSSQDDIIGKWQEPIDEEELDKIAYDYADYNVDEDEDMRRVMCHYKAGYRKAKEDKK